MHVGLLFLTGGQCYNYWVLLQDLDQRYNTILQMYGEKAEEAQELRLDLEDVKNMYKTQIDELLKQRHS